MRCEVATWTSGHTVMRSCLALTLNWAGVVPSTSGRHDAMTLNWAGRQAEMNDTGAPFDLRPLTVLVQAEANYSGARGLQVIPSISGMKGNLNAKYIVNLTKSVKNTCILLHFKLIHPTQYK